MKKIQSAAQLRSLFIEFFVNHGHTVIPSASLIPENDPTVLFTTAGMHPLVPYLMGEPHPAGKRLVNVQKCVRTGDIDDVGDTSHLTFFEMLGNWSLGDYFKKEMIPWSWEFLTSPQYLGLDPDSLAFSVFEGDEDAPGTRRALTCGCGQAPSLSRSSSCPRRTTGGARPGSPAPAAGHRDVHRQGPGALRPGLQPGL